MDEYKYMVKFLLAIFIIVLSGKMISENIIVYQSIDSKLILSSEEILLEQDEKENSKQPQDELFYSSYTLYIPNLKEFKAQLSSLKYCKPFSGFTSRLFNPPDLV